MIKEILTKLQEVKVDRRKKYIMCLDVETAGNIGSPQVYDLGFAVTDKKGNIYERFSFAIEEIFDNRKLMSTAYYAEKVPMYLKDIEEGRMIKTSFLNAREVFLKCMDIYRIETISAYNLMFDMRALKNTTEKLFGTGKRFLTKEHKDVDLLCIWSFACEVLYSRPSFIKFIDKHNFYTEKGNPLTSAEIGYRYLKNNPTFTEEHRGLQDVEIECEILAKCIAQKQKHESGILGSPWSIVSKYNKERKGL